MTCLRVGILLMIPAGDLVTAAAYLRQGGWVAPLAASLTDDVSFVISLCGPGGIRAGTGPLPGFDRMAGTRPARIDVRRRHEFRTKTIYLPGTGIGYEGLLPRYIESAKQTWFQPFRRLGFGATLPKPEDLTDTVFTFFRNLMYDPISTLARVKVPTLAMFDDSDPKVPTESSIKHWKMAFELGCN